MNQLANFENETMTLKEITDILGVRHNDAMNKVKNMAQEEDFGELRVSRISPKGKAGSPFDTFILDKRQSIAAASILSTKFFMRIIDRWEALENYYLEQMIVEQENQKERALESIREQRIRTSISVMTQKEASKRHWKKNGICQRLKTFQSQQTNNIYRAMYNLLPGENYECDVISWFHKNFDTTLQPRDYFEQNDCEQDLIFMEQIELRNIDFLNANILEDDRLPLLHKEASKIRREFEIQGLSLQQPKSNSIKSVGNVKN